MGWMGSSYWGQCLLWSHIKQGTAEESNKQGEDSLLPPPPATHNATRTKGELWRVCTGMFPWLHSQALLKSPSISKCLLVHAKTRYSESKEDTETLFIRE